MKKLIAIVAIMLLTPFAAFGLTALPDSYMNNITGQAGVSIDPEIDLSLHIDTTAWGDSDGLNDGVTTEGWVGVSDTNATLHVGVRSDYIAVGSGNLGNVELLTIDVATDPTAALYNGATFVRIGLGTDEVVGNIDFDVELGSDTTLTQQLGTTDILGLEILTHEGGYVDITTMGRFSGVTLGLNVLIDEINIDSLAWGDTDGIDHIDGYASFSATPSAPLSGAGYIGLANVAITGLSVTGALGIDTASFIGANLTAIDALTDGASHASDVLKGLSRYMAANLGETSSTLVLLTLGNADGTADANDVNVNMATFTATSALGATNDLSGVTGVDEMGSIYMAGANVMVDGLVVITAH